MSDIQKSCLHYQGSKYPLLKQHKIHEFIPPTNFDRPYCELFCGSAVMFFNLPNTTYTYLNDLDADLTNFWVQVQNHRQEFEDKIKYVWAGIDFVNVLQSDTTPLGRAVWFYIRNAVGTTTFTHPLTIQKKLDVWSKKMDNTRVLILNYDYAKTMETLCKLHNPTSVKAEKEGRTFYVVFYEDPPYFGSENVYGQDIFDHHRLYELNTKYAQEGHHIILSYNKCPEILDLYKEWYIEEFSYNIHADYSTPRTELLISNRKLQRYMNKYVQSTDLTSMFKKNPST